MAMRKKAKGGRAGMKARRAVSSSARKTRRGVRRTVRKAKVAQRRAKVRGKVAARKATVAVRRAKARSTVKRKVAAVSRKDGRPADWPAMTPYMTVRDAGASVRFYENAFGFKVTGELMRDGAGNVMHAGMRLGDAAIMFAPQGMSNDMRAPASSGAVDSLSLYIYVSDVDTLAARAERGGATVLQRPADQFWGDRIAVFKDPDGYHWTFATNVGEFDASQAPKG